jgi:hypothetical protein
LIHGFAGCKVHSEPSTPVCAVMTLAQINRTTDANAWRARVRECVG